MEGVVGAAVGTSVDANLDVLCELGLAVDVMLLDRRTNRVAIWRSGASRFRKETPLDPTVIKARTSFKVNIGEREMSFLHRFRLVRVEGVGGLTEFTFELEIETSGSTLTKDFRGLFDSLSWT